MPKIRIDGSEPVKVGRKYSLLKLNKIKENNYAYLRAILNVFSAT